MEYSMDEVPPAPVKRAVKLLPFRSVNPAAWFAMAEDSFSLCNTAYEESHFFNVLHALPE